MMTVRKSADRGQYDHGWLQTAHSFSFGDYYDPRHVAFSSLRVINEDVIQPGGGFPTHGHKDMEIVTYVISGELEHRDSMGNGSIIRAGEVQYMSAGRGVTHSECNPSSKKSVHLLQLWIFPDRKNYEPRYAQQLFTREQKRNQLCLMVSGCTEEVGIHIRQNAKIVSTILEKGHELRFETAPLRKIWVQVISGELQLNGQVLQAGDGAALTDTTLCEFHAKQADSEFLIFDLE